MNIFALICATWLVNETKAEPDKSAAPAPFDIAAVIQGITSALTGGKGVDTKNGKGKRGKKEHSGENSDEDSTEE
ncbi:unnamed protein product [Orchesella dallaii]|uniref:Secreted protein n=1 Tax=Orchesella dallaii TaxID=48710 RepID=A0ABP1RZ50_9HEXA